MLSESHGVADQTGAPGGPVRGRELPSRGRRLWVSTNVFRRTTFTHSGDLERVS